MFSPSSYKLLFVQILLALSIIPFLIYASWFWIGIAAVFYVLYAGFGVAIAFHRTLSHRAFQFHPFVKYAITVIGSMANVGSPLTWVATHRAHHLYCDTSRDPHSPHHHPAWFVLFTSMFAKVSLRTVKDLLKDPFILFLHKYYFLIQVPWIFLLAMIGGWQAVFACHFIPGALTWLAGSFLNWFNHLYGYRNTEIEDSSRNHWLTALIVMGEGWHNNHHARPISATTQVKKHEVDILYYLGRLLGGKPCIKS
jgi:fatty-acid desaturase